MLAVSAEFLQAIKDKKPQDVRLEFADGSVIDKNSISITSGGLTYAEILNGDTDMTFGRAVMSELSAVLVNAGGRFTEFDFTQEFTAKFGVGVDRTQVAQSGENTVSWTSDADGYYYQYKIGTTSNFWSYYRAPGATSASGRTVSCSGYKIIIVYGDYNVYAIGEDYSILKAWVRESGTNTHTVVDTPSTYPAGLTAEQVKEWVDAGTFVRMVDVIETEYINLGVFRGERPEKVRGRLIDFTARDRMSLFDRSAASFADGLTFPCTLGEIFAKLCDFCGVGYVSSVFTNLDKTFDTNPLENTDYTCRNILGWIAEAAGSYARMSRDGAVELVWFAPADYTVTRTDRFEMTESEFLTPPIDKLEVYNSYGDQLNSSGTGEIVYGISDNPFLYIENDTQLEGLQPYADAIYDRIVTFPAYQPSSFRAECNPAVQCGDIIKVVDDYDVTISFPVFMQTITWTGYAKVTYENTGGIIRQNKPVQQRELEQLKKKVSRLTTDLHTSIESYLNSQEGIASITQAVGGTFMTKEEAADLVTTSELDARIESYINGEEGIASITESLAGTFVLEDELDDYATKTEVSTSITQSISQFSASLKLSASVNGNSSTITLTGNGISAVSATMEFSGFVTYTDLASAGKTTINGANITTGKISAEYIDVGELSTKRVIFNDDEYEFNVISSELLSTNNAAVTVGLTDYLLNDEYGQYLNLYGTQIYMIHTGYDLAAGDSDNYSIKFDMANRQIISGSSNWSIGYFESVDDYNQFGDAVFDYLYAGRIYCDGRICMGEWGETYPCLRYYNDELRWYTDSSTYTTLA